MGGRKKSNPPASEGPAGAGAVTYRRGWLVRKVLAEAEGKKSEWGGTGGGMRGWMGGLGVWGGGFGMFFGVFWGYFG